MSYSARQAIGPADRRRQLRLQLRGISNTEAPPRGPVLRHLRAVQATALQLWREEDLTPLGIRVSAVADMIHRAYGIRADALFSDRVGIRLVWVEVLDCREQDIPLYRRQELARKRDLMAEIGRPFQVDVEWRLHARDHLEQWEVPFHPGESSGDGLASMVAGRPPA